jgi:hypothetical protein
MMIIVMGPVTKVARVITTMAPSQECSILPALGIPHGQNVLLANPVSGPRQTGPIRVTMAKLEFLPMLCRRPLGSLLRASPRLVMRRLRAAVAEFPRRDAELSRLVGQVLLDAGAGENEDADRQQIHPAFDRCA